MAGVVSRGGQFIKHLAISDRLTYMPWQAKRCTGDVVR